MITSMSQMKLSYQDIANLSFVKSPRISLPNLHIYINLEVLIHMIYSICIKMYFKSCTDVATMTSIPPKRKKEHATRNCSFSYNFVIKDCAASKKSQFNFVKF